MSSPAQSRDPDEEEKSPVDQLDENPPSENAEPGSSATLPPKRGRGRPRGSKNKKTSAAASAPASTTPKKRGRPPKEKKETGEEPPPKRPRGRPPKNPKPVAGPSSEGTAPAESAAPPVKRKRGRPPKNPKPADATP